jgi:hypothetical protein
MRKYQKYYTILLMLCVIAQFQSCETSYISSPVETPNRVLQKSTTVTKSVIYTNPADPAIALLMVDSVRYFKLYGPKGFNGIAQYINAYEFVDQNDTTENFSVIYEGHKIKSMVTSAGTVSFRYPDDTTFICIFNDGDSIAPFIMHTPPESTHIPLPGKDYGDDIREASSATNWPKIRANVNGELQGFGSRPADDAVATIEFSQNGFVVASGIMNHAWYNGENYYDAPVPLDLGVTPYPPGSVEAINVTISLLQATISIICNESNVSGIGLSLRDLCYLIPSPPHKVLCNRVTRAIEIACALGAGDLLNDALDQLKVDPDAGFYNHIDPTATFTIKVNSPRYGKSECGPFLVSDYVNGGVVNCDLPTVPYLSPSLTILSAKYLGACNGWSYFYELRFFCTDFERLPSNWYLVFGIPGTDDFSGWADVITSGQVDAYAGCLDPSTSKFKLVSMAGGVESNVISVTLPNPNPK